jgi:hypothetical protein
MMIPLMMTFRERMSLNADAFHGTERSGRAGGGFVLHFARIAEEDHIVPVAHAMVNERVVLLEADIVSLAHVPRQLRR